MGLDGLDIFGWVEVWSTFTVPIVTALYTERVWHDPIRIERNDEKKEGVEAKENQRGCVFWDAGAT